LNPSWVTKIEVIYNFEKNDEFKVDVYDIDDDKHINAGSSHDPLGSLQFTLHEVVTQRDQHLHKQLPNPAKPSIKSMINIVAEEVQSNANSEICCFETQCKLSDSGNLYFFIVYKMKQPGQYSPVYKSETRRQGSNGFTTWNPCSIGCTDLCNDNVEQEIKFEFFRNETSGKHKNLAHFITTMAVLKSGGDSCVMPISGSNKCTLNKLHFEKKHSFLEYVFGGCDIDLTMAIDFTLSNGAPNNPDSLHYWNM